MPQQPDFFRALKISAIAYFQRGLKHLGYSHTNMIFFRHEVYTYSGIGTSDFP
jgi:hypothetical protein